ncbi:MAG: hypothetical protein ACW99R_03320 [Candidatus Hodarchaeales archaeon]|jgi:rRNA maturation protein Rpf1
MMADNEREGASPLLITTSRNPSHFIRRVSKLISFSLPFSKRMNRGSLSLKEIRNFCWNMGIDKVFIVQSSRKIDSISLCCYDFVKSPLQIDVEVKLMNFNFPQKGDKNTRIENKNILIDYTPDIPESLKEHIHNFIKPLLVPKASKPSKTSLKIKFRDYLDGKFRGEVVRNDPKNQLPLLSFEITLNPEVA